MPTELKRGFFSRISVFIIIPGHISLKYFSSCLPHVIDLFCVQYPSVGEQTLCLCVWDKSYLTINTVSVLLKFWQEKQQQLM